MRLFFLEWTGKKFGMIDIVRELKDRGHTIVYWSGPNLKDVSPAEFQGTIFHDHFDALFARPAPGVDTASFPPLGEALIASLSSAESETLTMMSKLFETMQVNERKHLYYEYLRYWNGVLDRYRPDALIFPNVPHTVYDFVLYSLAKGRGIKVLLFELTRVNDRSLLIGDMAKGSMMLKQELLLVQGKKYALSDLPLDVRAYYEGQIGESARARPKDIVDLLGRFSGLSVFKVKLRSFWTTLTIHKDLSVFGKLITYFPRRLHANQKTEYEGIEQKPDFEKPFVYVPLQYQPEATTSPLGGIFVDQLLMIETLAASLPQGFELYVKEHPLQWKPRGLDYFSYRYRGFYRAIALLPHVRLVPMETESSLLIEKGRCVASVNGTAGWEALLRGKPSLTFGYAWYRDCPGVFKISDSATCKAALQKVEAGLSVGKQEIIDYLYVFGKIAMNGFREQYCMDVSKVSVEQSIANHVAAIETALKAS